MHRRALLDLLDGYLPSSTSDAEARERIRAFVEAEPSCFERTTVAGHVTGSAWIVDPWRTRCLLTHHRKLDRWLQLGGHADGDPDVQRVAMREAREESGLAGIRLVDGAIFDCDVHLIPARGAEAAHWHYDVRFLLEADPAEPLSLSSESKDLAWVAMQDVPALASDESVARMVAKTARLR